jgi:hypothetical protein
MIDGCPQGAWRKERERIFNTKSRYALCPEALIKRRIHV